MNNQFLNTKTLEELNSAARNFDFLYKSSTVPIPEVPRFTMEKVKTDDPVPFDIGQYVYDLKKDAIASARVAEAFCTPVDQLTPKEKLGILWGAGVPIKMEDNKFNTYVKVGIELNDRKYHVYVQDPPIVHYR